MSDRVVKMTADVEELRASALKTCKRIGMHQKTASEHLKTMFHEQELARQAVARAEAARHALECIEAMIGADTAEYDAKMEKLAHQQHTLSCMRREQNMMLVLEAYWQEATSPELPLLPVSSSTAPAAHHETADISRAEQGEASPSDTHMSFPAGWVPDSDTEPTEQTEPAEQRREQVEKRWKRTKKCLRSLVCDFSRRKRRPGRRDSVDESSQTRRNASAAGFDEELLLGIGDQNARQEDINAPQEEQNAQQETQQEEQNAQQEDWEM